MTCKSYVCKTQTVEISFMLSKGIFYFYETNEKKQLYSPI